MDQAARAAIDKRQGRCHDRMLRSAETNPLREREPEDHPRLDIIGQALPRRAVDQRIQVGQPPQRFAGNGESQAMVGRGQVAHGSTGRIERAPLTKHGVKDLQRRPPRCETLLVGGLRPWHE